MVNPEELQRVQLVTSKITGNIRILYRESKLEMVLTSTDEQAKSAIPQILKQMSEALATQMSAFMRITGRIIEVK